MTRFFPAVFSGLSAARDIRIAGLFCALAIYALAGTPAPDHPGWAEASVGLFLLLAVGPGGGMRALEPGRDEAGWQRAGAGLLLYGLTVPFLTALAAGNDRAAILRDMIAFLFLTLPLFLYPVCVRRTTRTDALTVLALAIGFSFGLRVLWPVLWEGQTAVSDPFLLANTPMVLFSALFLGGSAGLAIYRGAPLSAILLAATALCPLTAMALIGQRASVGMACFTALALLGIGFLRAPGRTAPVLLLLALTLVAMWEPLSLVAETLLRKTEQVGLNMRREEALAVLHALSDSPLAVLFGRGWGATVVSPAVGGATVTFTHSLITTYWLKTGLAGMVLALAYIGLIGSLLIRILPRAPVCALALAAPFLIDVLLYASFKSLDFGLLLLLIALWAERSRQDDTGTAAERSRL